MYLNDSWIHYCIIGCSESVVRLSDCSLEDVGHNYLSQFSLIEIETNWDVSLDRQNFQTLEGEHRDSLRLPTPFPRRLSAPPPSVSSQSSPPPLFARAGPSSPQIFRFDDDSSAKVKAESTVIRIRVGGWDTPGFNQNLVFRKTFQIVF